jgi:hypothetical protein
VEDGRWKIEAGAGNEEQGAANGISEFGLRNAEMGAGIWEIGGPPRRIRPSADQRAERRGQRAEGRGERREERVQRTEDRDQRSENKVNGKS